MQISPNTIDWLFQGDPSICWQTMRDLTDADNKAIQSERKRIALDGWGKRFLSYQDDSGLWGSGLYSPKWISTTYTMILLRRLGLMPNHPQARKACSKLTENGFDKDGGINYFASLNHSETCVTGMILSVLSYFSYRDDRISGMVDFLLDQQMKDGGWNCESFSGARHGSFHTTLSVLEGLREFEKWDSYKQKESVQSRARAHEFLLSHRLYRSHRTGEVVDARMTRFSFPPRWHYDLLRVLDYFQECRLPYDTRMDDAFDILYKKQTKNGTWPLQNRHPGRTYFEIEQPGKPSRWNTLRSLRVMRWYKGD